MFSAAPYAWFLAVSLASGLARGAPAGAASVTPASPAVPFVAWRFHAGGTLSGPPAVAPDGTAYLGTSDGSLEALGEDGVLRWSVTLEGSAWPPVVDDRGRVFVATTAQRVHSFLSSGVTGWTLRSPVRIATDPVLASWGILFGGGDGSVWAVSSRGMPLWHVEVGQPLSAAAGMHGNRVVVGTASGDVVFYDGASRRFVAHLGGRIRSAPVVFRDGSAAILAGSTLYRLDRRAAVLWRRDGIDWFGRGGDALYAVNDVRELISLSGDGTPSRHVHLGTRASGPPVGDRGSVFVPCDSGDLVIVRADSAPRTVGIGNTPLYSPVIDAKRRRLLISSGDGTVAAVILPD